MRVEEMEIVAYIGKSHEKVIGYSHQDLANAITGLKPTEIIFTYLSREDFEDGRYGPEVSILLARPEFHEKIRFAGAGNGDGITASGERENAEAVVRRNIVDMIYSTIYAYLEGYWKDRETVNSEVTDALFRARRLLVSQIEGVEGDKKWEYTHEKILGNIKRMKLGLNPVLVVPVESAFWFKDNLQN
ncbi:MAG: hypothetical protein ACYCT2_07580 [Thermoplasmataceae archaeon]